jgi:hypothetical protein
MAALAIQRANVGNSHDSEDSSEFVSYEQENPEFSDSPSDDSSDDSSDTSEPNEQENPEFFDSPSDDSSDDSSDTSEPSRGNEKEAIVSDDGDDESRSLETMPSKKEEEHPAKRTKLSLTEPSLWAQANMRRLEGRRYQTRETGRLIQRQTEHDAVNAIKRQQNRALVFAEIARNKERCAGNQERRLAALQQRREALQQRRDGAATNVAAPFQPVPEQVESQPESSANPREQVPREIQSQTELTHAKTTAELEAEIASWRRYQQLLRRELERQNEPRLQQQANQSEQQQTDQEQQSQQDDDDDDNRKPTPEEKNAQDKKEHKD